MCGICGIILKQQKPDRQSISGMTAAMSHRGPDHQGICVNGNVALGMRRLSIIDLAGGEQPIYNEDKSISLVGNGEIYNYRDLREELEAKGHRFRSGSDMEVVPHLYEEYGPDFVRRLDGMFALALHDTARGEVLLFRDPRGIKPLFWHASDAAFLFASDINAILSTKYLHAEMNETALRDYFLYRLGSIGADSFFKGIHAMKPGGYIRVNSEKLHIEQGQYHNFDDISIEIEQGSEPELRDKARELFEQAVEKRLISDAPLGTLLSSGVDSSLITAVAAKLTGRKVEAFTIGYGDAQYDESGHASRTAKYLGIRNHIYKVEADEYAALLPKIVRYNEAPVTHPNSLPVHLITKLARDMGYKVLLSGEGADELFGGYFRTVWLNAIVEKTAKYPAWLFGLLKSIGYKLKADDLRLNTALRKQDVSSLLNLYFNVSPGRQVHELGFRFPERGSPIAPEEGVFDFKNPVEQCLVIEQKTYLQELLLRQDKMSMMSSMEVRVPFVDRALTDYVYRLPARMKIRGTLNKALLREIAASYLPRETAYMQKKGFGSPLAGWFRGGNDLATMLDDLHRNDYFDQSQQKRIAALVSEHRSGKSDHHELLWKLLNFKLWREAYGI